MKEINHIIQFSIDINDKYSFNNIPEYTTSENEINGIFEKVNFTVKSKVSEFLGE